MIDTHTHLYMEENYPDGGAAAVSRALDAGVEMMVFPAVDRESVAPMLALHSLFPQNTAVALGLHPTEVEDDWKVELAEILARQGEARVVAIGEAGIDLYWDKTGLHRQMDAFGEQIQIAKDRNLPIIVHSRDAVEETAEVIRSFGYDLPGLVFHSFTAGRPEAERLLEAAPDAFFGINGVVTFKNAIPLKEAVEWLDMSRIVTETDAPFLTPVPFRGKTNESAYIPYIAEAIANIKNLQAEEVKRLTAENALRLYPRLRDGDN